MTDAIIVLAGFAVANVGLLLASERLLKKVRALQADVRAALDEIDEPLHADDLSGPAVEPAISQAEAEARGFA